MKRGKKKDAVGLALQIVYEYEDWTEEHVSDMFNTYAECGDTPPCTGDDLEDLCYEADALKKKGLTYNEAEKTMLKGAK